MKKKTKKLVAVAVINISSSTSKSFSEISSEAPYPSTRSISFMRSTANQTPFISLIGSNKCLYCGEEKHKKKRYLLYAFYKMTDFIEVDEGTGKISIRKRVIRIRVSVPQIHCIKKAIMSSPKLESETITFNLNEIVRKLAESRKKPAGKPVNLQKIKLISISDERLPIM